MAKNDVPNNSNCAARSSFTERSSTVRSIERQITLIGRRSSLDDLAAALDASEWLLSRAKTIRELAKLRAIEWIEQNGSFCIGPIEYTIGYTTTTRCMDVIGVATAVLNASGGDLHSLLNLLVSQPYKHGSVRRVISEPDFRSLFETRRSSSLKTGEPTKALQQRDRRFTSRSQMAELPCDETE